MRPLVQDGDVTFVRGMDSLTPPELLEPGFYAYAENVLNRGGVLRARPGFTTAFTLPDGVLQGLAVYHPRQGEPVLLAFVGGVPYAASAPYTSFRVVEGARMSATARQVHAQMAVQTVERNPDGSLRLIFPRNLLMVQDGENPPAYFDGRVLTAITGRDATPQGTIMAWAGNRLWVARREKVFASDIANPLSFVEQSYNTLGGLSYFLLPGECTGMVVLPGQSPSVKSPLLVFTRSTTTMLRGNIVSRALWPTVEDFQTVVFPSVGCVAPRSIVSAHGLVWWLSESGVVSLDAVKASQETGRLLYVDKEMSRSGVAMRATSDTAAAAAYENLLLFSLPAGGSENRHTWVLDVNPHGTLRGSSAPAWVSVWTGVRPVQWASFSSKGRVWVFVASKDADGHNRVYAAFGPDGRDNGVDIPWAIETRAYAADSIATKQFRFAEYLLTHIRGHVTMRVSWAGAKRGRWKTVSTPEIRAAEGSIRAGVTYDLNSKWEPWKAQSRLLRTQDVVDLAADAATSAGVDGRNFLIEADKETLDTAFQLRFEGSGPCALAQVRVFMEPVPDPVTGDPDNPEKEERIVRGDGAASLDTTTLESATEPEFTAEKTARAEWRNFAAQASGRVTSRVSQADADKRALQVAQARAEAHLRRIAVPYGGG